MLFPNGTILSGDKSKKGELGQSSAPRVWIAWFSASSCSCNVLCDGLEWFCLSDPLLWLALLLLASLLK